MKLPENLGELMRRHAEEALAEYDAHKNDPRPMNPNNLSHWFPLVQAAGLPVPRTIIVPGLTNEGLWGIADGVRPENMDAIVRGIKDAGAELGWPCFLRTGQTSYKHDWLQSCFCPTPELVLNRVLNLCEFSMMADMMGLQCDEFVVRELLDTVAPFTAFNGMPVAREIRYFFEGGRVTGWQGYWPEDAIENPSCEDWSLKLEELQDFQAADLGETEAMALRAGQAAAAGGLCAEWSVDFLQTKTRGWVLIDMAVAAQSFRSPDFHSCA